MNDPNTVSDIIFQVGLNNLNDGWSPEKIKERTFEMQKKYNEKFPHARQHITGLPPLETKHRQTNKLLQELKDETKSNYITTKKFLDNNTKQPRLKLFKVKNNRPDFHYNEGEGIKTLAKAIRRSLYSFENMEPQQLSQLRKTQPPLITIEDESDPIWV